MYEFINSLKIKVLKVEGSYTCNWRIYSGLGVSSRMWDQSCSVIDLTMLPAPFSTPTHLHTGFPVLSGDMRYFCCVHTVFPVTGMQEHSDPWSLLADGIGPSAPMCQDLVKTWRYLKRKWSTKILALGARSDIGKALLQRRKDLISSYINAVPDALLSFPTSPSPSKDMDILRFKCPWEVWTEAII